MTLSSPKAASEAAAPPASPRPWSFRRTLSSPSRKHTITPKSTDEATLWEDGVRREDSSDGDAVVRVSLEELDVFVDVVALNKRTGKRSIIRLARGTVMSDVFAAYAQHTRSDPKRLAFVRGDGKEQGRPIPVKARVADLRRPTARTPRKRRAEVKSFDEQIWNRAVAIGHDAWDETHFGSLSAGASVSLPLNRDEVRPVLDVMELSIHGLDEEESWEKERSGGGCKGMLF